jgi:predicted metal-dependent phosphoesterase TrpH
LTVFDLHVHTTRGSSDSSLTPAQLAQRARDAGLDGVCLTEHGGGWTDRELEETFAGSGVTVIRGLEVDTDAGHVLVFGLTAYVNGMHRIEELRSVVDRAGGAMVSAHPFRNLFNRPPDNPNLLFHGLKEPPKTAEEAAGHRLFRLVDAIEVANGSNTERENRFALDVAAHLGLAGTGGSDAHSEHGLGKHVTVFDGSVTSERDLIDAIRAGAVSPTAESVTEDGH